MKASLYDFDRSVSQQSGLLLAGVDEVGRGPLAGPVVAGAVLFYPQAPEISVNDSKQLSPQKRQKLYYEILQNAFVGIGVVDEATIDEINIYQATRLAMKRAVLALNRTPDFVLIDGNMKIDLPIPQQAVIKGDTKSAAIAAASIIAKVYRDQWMDDLDSKYPGYGFQKHKGYPTPQHLNRLHTMGPCPVHRRSFAPVQQAEAQKVFL